MAIGGFRRRWRVMNIAQPAPGADWEIKAPGSSTLRVVSVTARLTASADVANRIPTFIADDQTRTWWTQIAAAAQTAGLTWDHCLATGIGHAYSITGVVSYPLPTQGLLLRPGNRLRVVTAALDDTDQWSAITALVDEIPSDTPLEGDAFTFDPND